MSWRVRARLRVPMSLAVTSFVPGCVDDGGDTTDASTAAGSASDTGTPTTDTGAVGSSGAASDGSTAAGTGSGDGTTSAGTTGADGTGSDTGELVGCNQVVEQAACEADPVCLWSPQGYCYVNCPAIPDMATCNAQIECLWMEDACDYGAI